MFSEFQISEMPGLVREIPNDVLESWEKEEPLT